MFTVVETNRRPCIIGRWMYRTKSFESKFGINSGKMFKPI